MGNVGNNLLTKSQAQELVDETIFEDPINKTRFVQHHELLVEGGIIPNSRTGRGGIGGDTTCANETTPNPAGLALG